MFGFRILVISALLAVPGSAGWTAAQKGWALGTSAVLTELDGARHDVLWEPTEAARRTALQILNGTWNIHSREDIFANIPDMMADDSTPLRIGWNYPRV